MEVMQINYRLPVSLAGMLCVSAAVQAQAVLRPTGAIHAAETAQLDHQYAANSMTVHSVRDGVWSDAGTWDKGVPTPGAKVQIAPGHVVIVDTTEAVASIVRNDGTLTFDPRKPTRLILETLYGSATSQLLIGTAVEPVTASARLTFRSSGAPIDHTADPFEFGRGLVTHGHVEMHGRPKTAWVATSRSYAAGAQTLTLDTAPSGWAASDRVVVTAPHFGQDETRTITAIDGRTLVLSEPLRFGRSFPAADPRPFSYALHVGNLTRNVVIETDETFAGQPAHQGHVMLMHHGGHRIRYVAFNALGRTHVKSPVNDPLLVDGVRNPQLMPICGLVEENVRGRYGLHFHMALPTSEASIVEGIALVNVRDSKLRIGLQNHSSHVRVRDSVVMNVDGFGLFTEEGDERGEYARNLIVYGRGKDASLHEDVRDNCMRRNGYEDIMERRRLAVGWRGGGIWLHGGQVDVVDNVIMGHDNVGIDVWERPLHHMACVIADGCKTYQVMYPAALVREGTDWMPADLECGSRCADGMVQNSIPPFLLRGNQIYGIGGPGQNRSRTAYSLHYMKVWETWVRHHPGRPRNLISQSFVWNVPNGITTTYTEYARVEKSVFARGELLADNVGDLSRVVSNGIKMNAQGGEQHDLDDLTLIGYTNAVWETPYTCYRDIRVDGKPFTPSLFNDGGCIEASTTEPPPPPPAVTLEQPEDITTASDDGEPVVVSYPTPEASDGVPPLTVSCAPASGSLFPVGETTVVCTATDSIGQTAEVSFTVEVTSLAPAPVVVSIQGTQFVINGTPTYAGTKVQGLLIGARWVQAAFDDENPDTVGNFKYPDTNVWDPERNVSEFIAALPAYKAKGVNVVSVNMQGGSPGVFSGNKQPNITSAFNADGSLKPAWMSRLDRVIRAADANGMVVILGYFYFGQDNRLSSEAAVLAAVENATNWLVEGGYTNVLVEIANESNVNYQLKILQPDRVTELLTLVQTLSAGALKVSVSFGGGYTPPDAVIAAADYVLTHANGLDADGVIARINTIQGRPAYQANPKPIVFNEGHRRIADFDAAVSHGASWSLYLQGANNYIDGYQSPPVNWTMNTETKQAWFDRVAFWTESTGEPPPPPPPPPPSDTTAPVISSGTPQLVTQQYDGVVEASDPSGIQLIEVRLDGVVIASASVTSLQYTIDLAPLALGPHVVDVRVVDAAGNVATQSFTLMR